MLTMYTRPGTERPTAPPPEAVAAYRRHIQDLQGQPGEPDPAILDAAWRIREDFAIDRHVYQNRRDARFTLDHTIPDLERQHQEARAAHAAEVKAGGRLLTEFSTVAELAAALQQHVIETTPGILSPNYVRAQDFAGEIGLTRQSANETLRSTSDPAISAKLQNLGNQAHDLDLQISDTMRIVNIETTIAKQVKLCASLSESRNERDKAKYREARATLAELHGIKTQIPEATAAVAVARERLADVQARIRELEATRLIPENQAWSK